jgi:hypothetical protein
MSHIRLTASVMFTIEMTKAVLAQQSLLVGVSYDKPWLSMDINTRHADENSKVIGLTFKLHDEQLLQSVCRIEYEHGEWVRGACSIRLLRIDPDRYWDFSCEFQDDKFFITVADI